MKLTPDHIKHQTYFGKAYYDSLKQRLLAYEDDIERERRLRTRQCKTCFYIKNHLAGQAFTEYTCRNCGAEGMHPNTGVPRYCDNCADEYCVCKDCGARIDG